MQMAQKSIKLNKLMTWQPIYLKLKTEWWSPLTKYNKDP